MINTIVIYIQDWLFVIKTLFEVWFLSCPDIERRLRFLDDALNEKRKKQLPYIIITFLYKSMIA
jgi:hypothetical protein